MINLNEYPLLLEVIKKNHGIRVLKRILKGETEFTLGKWTYRVSQTTETLKITMRRTNDE